MNNETSANEQATPAFTPGPWWPLQTESGRWWVGTRRDRAAEDQAAYDCAATICCGIGDDTEARTRGHEEANARLIAAAPDLFEALSELADLMDDVRAGNYKPDTFTNQQARAALAKVLSKS